MRVSFNREELTVLMLGRVDQSIELMYSLGGLLRAIVVGDVPFSKLSSIIPSGLIHCVKSVLLRLSQYGMGCGFPT